MMGAESLDMLACDGVTVTAIASGAGHPECASHPANPLEFKIATKHGGARPGAGRPCKVAWAAVQPPVVAGGRWHCIEFGSGRDVLVINQLQARGFEVFLPLYLPAPDKPLAPALGRYLFVRFDATAAAWRVIPGLLGVVRLFSRDAERPIALADAEIARLRRLFGEDGEATRPAAPAAPLPVGAAVRVVSGLLAGHVGVGVVEWSSGAEVRVRFGAKPVTMARAAVEIAGPSQP
jgi:hypothetical protein